MDLATAIFGQHHIVQDQLPLSAKFGLLPEIADAAICLAALKPLTALMQATVPPVATNADSNPTQVIVVDAQQLKSEARILAALPQLCSEHGVSLHIPPDSPAQAPNAMLRDAEHFAAKLTNVATGPRRVLRLVYTTGNARGGGADKLKHVAKLLKHTCSHLQQLALVACGLHDKGLAAALCTALRSCTALMHLDISDNALASEIKSLAAPIARLTALQTLNLSTNKAGPAGTRALGPVSTLPRLQHLNLSANALRSGGAAVAAPLLGLTGLTHLDVGRNLLGKHGLNALLVPLSTTTHLVRLPS